MSAGDVIAMLGVLVDAYPHQRPNQSTVQLYCEVLGDYPRDELELAAKRHIGTAPRFPSIAELKAILDGPAHRVPKWREPTTGELASGDEVRSIVQSMLDRWEKAGGPVEREPGGDDE